MALVPGTLPRLREAGLATIVESGAGSSAGFPDDAYREHGATIGTREEVLDADVLLQVHVGRGAEDALERLRPGQTVVGLTDVLAGPEWLRPVAERSVDLFALDLLPRTARAQLMDALSSNATITGYKAVVLAAERLPKMFPLLTTAAGTLPAAQVFVIGAGVAGLTAIATAKRLGAVVQAYDVRPAGQEEIESVGARAVSLDVGAEDAEDTGGYAKQLGAEFYARQQNLLRDVIAAMDVVVTTALIPGRPSPVLVTEEAVMAMASGTVIVDCAAERGGNCALTRADEIVVTSNGVTILGPTNLPATVPRQASQMYARHVTAFLLHVMERDDGDQHPSDDIVGATLVARGGQVVNARVLERLTDEEGGEDDTRSA
ncbi:MAG: NAD(P) transhydrogenase subunit alpha [Actinomycetota bacterium]|nr:NAD(P) transhydrogenase subunit alpha [Actinomycetota bacterium]